jgi:hypothetical protein
LGFPYLHNFIENNKRQGKLSNKARGFEWKTKGRSAGIFNSSQGRRGKERKLGYMNNWIEFVSCILGCRYDDYH